MLDWGELCLKPYVADVPRGIVPLLLLDDLKVHKMGVVVQAIQALGVEVEFIPPGCTGMVQPVDVGYNKPLKAKVCDQYREWIFCARSGQADPLPHSSSRLRVDYRGRARDSGHDGLQCMEEDRILFFPNEARVYRISRGISNTGG